MQAEESLRELRRALAHRGRRRRWTRSLQLRDRLDPKFVMGKGKLDEIVLRAAELDVGDLDLRPQPHALAGRGHHQAHRPQGHRPHPAHPRHLRPARRVGATASSRSSSRSSSTGCRWLSLKDDSLSRLTGGIGGRGPGETKLEIGRRRAKERVSFLEAQLKKLARQREQRRRRRARGSTCPWSPSSATRTRARARCSTRSPAPTCSPRTSSSPRSTRARGASASREEREVVITDTVGFIRDLPKDLFAAFRATFEEAADADLLLHVVDASDPARDQHIETTEALLTELGLIEIPRILVFNKIDLLDPRRGAPPHARPPRRRRRLRHRPGDDAAGCSR